ncbi:MAG TPA: hypothetical protein VK636_13525, partial [Gemmatimonadaceae bacterium]|nr:hypothetical protein [Gemmatimonadaceae bacterium]
MPKSRAPRPGIALAVRFCPADLGWRSSVRPVAEPPRAIPPRGLGRYHFGLLPDNAASVPS